MAATAAMNMIIIQVSLEVGKTQNHAIANSTCQSFLPQRMLFMQF
jgi:hypothetical protein